jgi:hypothetical protein
MLELRVLIQMTSSFMLIISILPHINLTQSSKASTKLQVCLHSLQNPHVCESYLAYEFQFGVFRECGQSFGDAEHGRDYIMC